MSASVAIIADDLTGALDSSTPFVLAGRRVAVACEADAIGEAVATGADVVAVNTASRDLPAAEAATLVRRCAEQLASIGAIAFKKVDSRLKGNITAEIEAALAGFGRTKALVLPAVPSEGRSVVGGRIVGRGVAVPIDIGERLASLRAPFEAPDAPDQAALMPLVSRLLGDRQLLAVGARGLAMALAAAMPAGNVTPMPFPPVTATLFAIGSRDPITLAAVDRLLEEHPVLMVSAPDGVVPPPVGLPATITVLMTTRGGGSLAEAEVAASFARGVVAHLARLKNATAVLCGGDTTLAVLRALGVRVIAPRGEVSGMPWFEMAGPGGGRLTVLTKSGGFGAPDILADRAPA